MTKEQIAISDHQILGSDLEQNIYAVSACEQIWKETISEGLNKEEIESAISDLYALKGLQTPRFNYINGINDLDKELSPRRDISFKKLRGSNFNKLLSIEELKRSICKALKIPYNDPSDKRTSSAWLYHDRLIQEKLGRKFMNLIFCNAFSHKVYYDRDPEMISLSKYYIPHCYTMSFRTDHDLAFKFLSMVGFEIEDRIKELMNISLAIKKNAYKVIFSDNEVFVLKKPKLHLDPQREGKEFPFANYNVHKVDGHAMIFPDGSKFSYFNGKKIANWYWEQKDSVKKMIRILRIRNTEIRTMAINYVGRQKLMSYLDQEETDKKGDYRVILFKLPGRFPSQSNWRPYLEMRNPSTGEIHIEGIDPRIRKVDTALKWRLGLKSYEKEAFKS